MMACGVLLFNCITSSASNLASLSTLFSIGGSNSSYVIVVSNPKISSTVADWLLTTSFFTCSATLKSSKYASLIASVISSPAVGTMPYATIVSSFAIAISLVPAPISIKATFKRLIEAGTSTWMAAIGSSVNACIDKLARSKADNKDCTTTFGRNVAMTSTFASSPSWSIKEPIVSSSI